MHAAPPIYHRDIRKENIIKKIGSDDWYLIDFADASLVPTTAATHLSPEGHSPRIQHDGHGAEVDIWGVANFMHELHSVVKDPQQVQQMATKWKEDLNLTAAKALSEIKVGPALHHCNVFIFLVQRSKHLFIAEVTTNGAQIVGDACIDGQHDSLAGGTHGPPMTRSRRAAQRQLAKSPIRGRIARSKRTSKEVYNQAIVCIN